MSGNRKLAWTGVGLILGFLAAGAGPAIGDLILIDDSSTVGIDPNTQDGMKSWVVDGTEHLYQQWFWYRTGTMTKEESIDTLTLDIAGTTDTDFDGNDESAFMRYVKAGEFKIEIYLTLNGGAPGSTTADIGESIEITNLSGASLEFHFFEYCDFDLNATVLDARVEILGGNTAKQRDDNCILSETVETPLADHYEVNLYDNTLVMLNDANADSLNDDAGPLTNDNLTWAFEWDFTVGAGKSFLISKDKLIVPEPGTMAILGFGGLAVLLRRRWGSGGGRRRRDSG